MAEPHNQSVRLERRLRLALRLVLYPLAIGLIVLAWQRTHSQTVAHDLPRPVRWRGQTSQHQAISMATAFGRLTNLRTFVLMGCTDGSSVGFDIVMRAQDLARHGDRFRGSQQAKVLTDSTGRTMTVRAWVRASATGNVNGTLTAAAVTIDRRVGCEAQPVGFASLPISS